MGGGKERFAVQLYAGWLTSRQNPTISRGELTALFGCDKKTLRRCENDFLQGIVKPRANFAQCPGWESFYNLIPEHAVSYQVTVRHQGRLKRGPRVLWQLPNIFSPPA